MYFHGDYLPSAGSPYGYLGGHRVFLCHGAGVISEEAVPPSLTFGVFCQIYDLVVNLLFDLFKNMRGNKSLEKQ